LLCHLLRLDSKEELLLSRHKGAVVETFAVAELLKQRMNIGKKPNLTFFVTAKALKSIRLPTGSIPLPSKSKAATLRRQNCLQIQKSIRICEKTKRPETLFFILVISP